MWSINLCKVFLKTISRNTQLTFTCLRPATETPEKGVECAQS